MFIGQTKLYTQSTYIYQEGEKGGCKGIQVSKLILMAQRDKEKELHFNINIDKEEGITQKVRCNRKS